MAFDALRDLLRSATVLGAELETRYRVLALTVEPLDPPDDDEDPRRQVLLHPVGHIAASLRRATDTGTEILTFDTEQLPDVVAQFGGAVPEGDPLPAAPPPRDDWGPQPSLEGRSDAPDGSSRHLDLRLRRGDLALDLHVTFDAAEVRDARGDTIEL